MTVNERAIEIFALRSKGETLEAVGSLYGVTRERIRQIESKVHKTFWNVYEKQKYDLIMLVYALRNGDNVLHFDELKNTVGDEFAAVLWACIKHNQEHEHYYYSKTLDAIVVKTDDAENMSEAALLSTIDALLTTLPDVMLASEKESTIAELAEKNSIPKEALNSVFDSIYQQSYKTKYPEAQRPFKVMVFDGVRAEESDARSTYTMISDGNKHAVQFNCSPILEWSSCELFLYIFKYGLLFNKLYRYGAYRVGCKLCPMASEWYEWLELYFELLDDFWANERMGKYMIVGFKTWLKEAEITENNALTPLGEKLQLLGSDSPITWGVIYTNLCYESPIINWYAKKIEVGRTYFADDLPILLGEEYSATVKKNALSSLKETLRLSPIGWLLLQGECEVKGKTVATITKGSWYDAEPIVILYSLYKFAERMEGMYSFTLSDLLEDNEERAGLSPRAIFGIERETLKPILQGLANNYSSFIQVDFNKGIMENIDLPAGKNGKKAIDVLSLI